MTTTDKTYNGWTNYGTWNVKLWLDNEEPSYRLWTEAAQECYDEVEASSYQTRKEAATHELAGRLRAYIEDENPLADSASMFSDLLSAALSEVNWHEIAAAYMDDVEEETEKDEV